MQVEVVEAAIAKRVPQIELTVTVAVLQFHPSIPGQRQGQQQLRCDRLPIGERRGESVEFQRFADVLRQRLADRRRGILERNT